MMDPLRVAIVQTLADNGISGNHDGLHGWRCAYPDLYGTCGCVVELVDDLVEAIQPMLNVQPKEA